MKTPPRDTLFERTRDLHHAVEHTVLGQRMVKGTASGEDYARWLAMKRELAAGVEPHLPGGLRGAPARYDEDLDILGLGHPPTPKPIWRYVKDHLHQDAGEVATGGALYVYLGSLLMGGPELAAHFGARGWPSRHLDVPRDARKRALRTLTGLRRDVSLEHAAKDCFQALLDSCDEIVAKHG